MEQISMKRFLFSFLFIQCINCQAKDWTPLLKSNCPDSESLGTSETKSMEDCKLECEAMSVCRSVTWTRKDSSCWMYTENSSVFGLDPCAWDYSELVPTSPDYSVECSDSRIKVIFSKSELCAGLYFGGREKRNFSSIGWKIPTSIQKCNVNFEDIVGDEFTLEADFPNGCGLTEFYDNDFIYYNQTIELTFGTDSDDIITRKYYDHFKVSCIRNRTVQQTLKGNSIDVDKRKIEYSEKNNTSAFKFNFTHSDESGLEKSSYTIGDEIKFQITLDSGVDTVKAVVQRCWSTSDRSNNVYYLIDGRCPVDANTMIYKSMNNETGWQTEAYRYLSPSSDAIYVECLIRICLETDRSGECSHCSSKQRREADDGNPSSEGMAYIKSPVFYIVEKDPFPTVEAHKTADSVFSGTKGTTLVVSLVIFALAVAAAIVKKVFFPTNVAMKKAIDVNGTNNCAMA